MKIGIVTFVKADNYGAELQAYALQKKLNMMGYEAEVLDLEKEQNVMISSYRTIYTSFQKRIKFYGFPKGLVSFLNLLVNKIKDKYQNKNKLPIIEKKHKIFTQFFVEKIKHSSDYIKLEDIDKINFSYDAYVAGSDQIWNYMQTKRLDIFFLMFASKYNCKRISYAASFSVPDIPDDLIPKYRDYLDNLDAISVREKNAIDIINKCNPEKKATLVLDPTLLLTKEEWVNNLAIPDYLNDYPRIVLIYSLSGSKYIYRLAEHIASQLQAKVINIKNSVTGIKDSNEILHIEDAGPHEFITLFSKAIYVVTDSFHGTAFSINFNIPFTTLLNPVSNLNSRALSILELVGLKDRVLYDDGKENLPKNLNINFEHSNKILENYKYRSLEFLKTNLKK